MSDYPLPSYAASIWTAQGKIWLGLPPLEPGGKGHSVFFSMDEEGLCAALRVLRSREVHQPERIGTPGVPTQVLADQLLREARGQRVSEAAGRALALLDKRAADRTARKEAAKRKAELKLEDLGI